MLAEIEIPWNKELTVEQFEELKAAAIDKVPEMQKDKPQLEWSCHSLVVHLDAVKSLAPFSIKRIIENKSTELLRMPEQRNTTVINQKCEVAVPGLGLLCIKTVQVVTDCCTNELQAKLDIGWRILAICVQPDQRRPDYVLGRSD